MSKFIESFVKNFKRKLTNGYGAESSREEVGRNIAEGFKEGYLRDNPHMVDRNYKVKDHFQDTVNNLGKDTRYNEPKGKPQVARDVVDQTIEETEIYKRAKELILNAPTPVGYTEAQWQEAKVQAFDAQREQVGYGLDKYPEPLNADTWTIIETIDHSISEKIDDLHYSVMLRMKLEKEAREESEDTIKIYSESGLVAELTEEGKLRFNREPLPSHWLLKGTNQGFSMSGADHDGDTVTGINPSAEPKHYRHGTGKCWCE